MVVVTLCGHLARCYNGACRTSRGAWVETKRTERLFASAWRPGRNAGPFRLGGSFLVRGAPGCGQPIQAGDWGPAALTHREGLGHRGRCGGPRSQPHAGAGTPKLRPHRLTLDGAGVAAPTPLIRATCVFARAALITHCVRAKHSSRTRSLSPARPAPDFPKPPAQSRWAGVRPRSHQ